MKTIVLLTIFVFACAACVYAEDPDADLAKALKTKVTLDFKDTPVEEAVSQAARLAKVKVKWNPAALAAAGKPEEKINLRVKDMECGLALDWIAKLSNLEYHATSDSVYITMPGDPAFKKSDADAPPKK